MSQDPSDEERSGGHLTPASPTVLTVWAVIGLVGGWVFHRVAEAAWGIAPVVTWAQPLGLFLVAAILGGTAWATHRTLRVRHERLEPHRAVNRFVIARACSYVGALAAGAYVGYAVSWLGVHAELADQRILRSAVAALGGVCVVITALLLERACRVRSDDEEP